MICGLDNFLESVFQGKHDQGARYCFILHLAALVVAVRDRFPLVPIIGQVHGTQNRCILACTQLGMIGTSYHDRVKRYRRIHIGWP